MSPDVEDAFAKLDSELRERLLEMRSLIFEMAADCDVGELTETLKWGEPAYLTDFSQAGATIRLGRHKGHPECAAMFVNCQTTLVDEFRSLFDDELQFEGSRAVLISLTGKLPEALGSCVRLALSYHRRKREAR